jgi:hypothetical protein
MNGLTLGVVMLVGFAVFACGVTWDHRAEWRRRFATALEWDD